MGDIILFTPKAECDASHNLAGFINMCRYNLTIFGVDLDWDASAWDVTKEMGRRGRGGRVRITWNNYDASNYNHGNPMAQPFLDFAKAYMRYHQGLRPTKHFDMRLVALRALERPWSRKTVSQ